MAYKIFTGILIVLFIAVSVTLYKTDKKYSKLKVEIQKKQNLISDQLIYINKNNILHELGIKKSEKIKFSKISSKNINIFKQETLLNIFKNQNQLVRGINNFFPGSAYLDTYKDKLFLVSATGILGYAPLKNENTIIFNQIKNNIEEFLTFKEINKGNWFSVKDILLLNNKVFVSYTNEQKKIVGIQQ